MGWWLGWGIVLTSEGPRGSGQSLRGGILGGHPHTPADSPKSPQRPHLQTPARQASPNRPPHHAPSRRRRLRTVTPHLTRDTVKAGP